MLQVFLKYSLIGIYFIGTVSEVPHLYERDYLKQGAYIMLTLHKAQIGTMQLTLSVGKTGIQCNNMFTLSKTELSNGIFTMEKNLFALAT